MATKPAAHSDQTKAAVLAALLQGQSISSVARDYDIPKGTVSGWKRQAGIDAIPVATQKQIDLGEFVVAYLTEALTTIRAQAVQFRDPAWLAQQPAADAAVLHGVMVDKAIRLLEALSPADDAGVGVGDQAAG